jgi:LPS sulfotransferase NodH
MPASRRARPVAVSATRRRTKPDRESRPARRFVIVGSARTGTSFIADSLLRHEDVLMHGEPFQSENLDWHIREEVRDQLDLGLRQSDPRAFVDRIFELNAGRAAIGCKILNGQNDVALDHACARTDIVKIFMRRENALAAFSSFIMARETNVWNLQWPVEGPGTKVRFVPEAFWDFMVWQTRRDVLLLRAMAAQPGLWLEVTYHPKDMLSRLEVVLSFLRLDPARLQHSDYVRLNTSVIVDRFSNPEDVESMLRDIGHLDWREE